MADDDRRFDPKKCNALISNDRWNQWDPPQLLALSGLTSGQTVLELGSGPRFWTLPIAQIVGPTGQVIALDVCQELLDALASRNPPEHVRLVHGELPEINQPVASVDFVWVAFVFHEVEPPSALATQIRRVLRPSGRLAVLDWRPEATSGTGPPRHHRLSDEQVGRYVAEAGFRYIQTIWQHDDAYLLIAQ